MPANGPLRFEVEIQTTGPPITGSWARKGSEGHAFVGWTELFAGLDAAVASEPERESGPGSGLASSRPPRS
jgi:hypothetical protein